ncbi:type IV pilus twitching motility protein PilT [Acidisoma sp. L85]|uniref:type IV pilus twitching motility protein PilT n=1 Tax=Acidisoma sp. L85 TaxID=1641850 RepID=UPI0020B151A3|nr:ATPase, T2SS/T4P/T4SS family [Acidisoma sp. L85]
MEPRKDAPGLDGLLSWAYDAGASRIAFTTGHPVWIRVHGTNYQVTEHSLDEMEIASIANHLYGADGTARLQGGRAFDVAYSISRTRLDRLRFRLNATPIRSSRSHAANIVLRPIPELPPSLEQQRVEPGILDAFRPREGMVIVSGATGSGKSTLIAGFTMAKLLDPRGNHNINEGAAPVEYMLDRVKSPSSTITQTEIPRDLPTFEDFIIGCMRREPTDIIVGECRDGPTMTSAVQAAISGHVLTTTIHAADVPLTMQRIASLCPPDERDNVISQVAQSLRLIINQRLAISTDGRRTALREFLVFDSKLRTRFQQTNPSEWPALTRQAVDEQGQPYAAAIRRALEEGRITADVAALEMKELA